MSEDPSLPKIIITIDPDTDEYHAYFDQVPYGRLCEVLNDLVDKVNKKELPFDQD